MKTRYNNYVINHIDTIDDENETKLPWLIRLNFLYDKN